MKDVTEKENNEDEEEEEEFEEENEDEGNEAENKCGKDFENLLKEFKINFKKNDSNKTNLKGLSKDARSFSKTIEDYRYDEINEQRKENQEFNFFHSKSTAKSRQAHTAVGIFGINL